MRGLARLISSAISNCAKIGPWHETEAAAAARFFQHLGAENVGRHQIGRELHAPRVEAEHGAEGFDELGLGEARNADEQAMTAGQQRDQSFLDDLRLAENDRFDRRPRRGDALQRGLGAALHGGFE